MTEPEDFVRCAECNAYIPKGIAHSAWIGFMFVVLCPACLKLYWEDDDD